MGAISECRAQKTLILSCLFDNKAVFTEFKMPIAIIFACLSEFTSELEKECSTLYSSRKYPDPHHRGNFT